MNRIHLSFLSVIPEIFLFFWLNSCSDGLKIKVAGPKESNCQKQSGGCKPGAAQVAPTVTGDIDYPIITLMANQVCSNIKFFNAEGSLQSGTQDCSGLSIANQPSLKEENIRSGVTINGVLGKYEGFSPCKSDWQTGCVASSQWPATLAKIVAGRCLVPRAQ